MKKFIGIAIAVLVGTPVLAADMAVKAPPPPPAPIYSWTGFYVGGTLGYSVGHDPATDGCSACVTTDTDTIAPRGWLGGLELGYNWQADHVVLGFEADWQWTGEKDSFCLDCFPTIGRGIEQKLPWFATVRGRLGYAAGPGLIYVTGGPAFGRVETTGDCCFNGTSVTFNNQKSGWVFGTGIEAALAGNWSAKIEYLFLNLGGTMNSFAVPGTIWTETSEVHDHIFRVGLNYRFGATPYQAAYVPNAMPVKAPVLVRPYDWTGFYVGANVGYSAGRDAIAQSFAGVPNDLFTIAPSGWLGGAQLGYNWQANNLVLGVEADWQWTGQTDTFCRDCPITPGFTNQMIQQKLPWFATARGRVGYADGPVLFYATAGAAFTDVKTNYSEFFAGPPFASSFDNHKTGLAAGVGTEASLGGNWTAKAEYLYLDFGSFLSVSGSPNTLATLSTNQVRDNVFRLGVNYKFSSGPL